MAVQNFPFGTIELTLSLEPAGAPFTVYDITNAGYILHRLSPLPEVDTIAWADVNIGAEETATSQAIVSFDVNSPEVNGEAGGQFMLFLNIITLTGQYTFAHFFSVGDVPEENPVDPVDPDSPTLFLEVGVNTYQTYEQTVALYKEVFGINAFKTGTEEDRVAALVHAYNVINTMTFADRYGEYYELGALDAAALDALEPAFLKALRIAQIIEANELMDPNSLHYKRLDGLMSETIGESSMMFRPGNINNYPITRRSMMFLRNYVLLRARLFRA